MATMASNLEINKIYNEDCLETMRRMPDKYVDLILTDPPYGMDYVSFWRKHKFEKIENDVTLEWVEPFLKEAYRVLKDNTHIYLFCNDYAISDFRSILKKVGFTPKRTLVWVKNNHTSGDLEGDYANKTEFLLYAQKGRRLLNGGRDTNVMYFDRVGDMKHPTQKPTTMMNYLIEKSTNKNELVYDPYMGSGTTARACKDLSRNYIGSEISKDYCNIAEDRLKQETLF